MVRAQKKARTINTNKQRTSIRYCPTCEYKVRGEKHSEGEHHKRKGK